MFFPPRHRVIILWFKQMPSKSNYTADHVDQKNSSENFHLNPLIDCFHLATLVTSHFFFQESPELKKREPLSPLFFLCFDFMLTWYTLSVPSVFIIVTTIDLNPRRIFVINSRKMYTVFTVLTNYDHCHIQDILSAY